MSGCTVQRLEAPGLTFLKISGTIDETFSANQLSQQIRADTILHLGKVTRFSSFGVREWVRLMKELQGRVKHCILVECSPAVVNQLNMVVDFAAGAHVKSVQLPYACQRCELDKMVTVDVDADRAKLLSGTLPQVPCPQCHNPMVFDDLPGSYLAFLRDGQVPEPGSPMASFIASFEQAAPRLEAAEGSPAAAAPAAAPAQQRAAAPAIDPTVPPPGLGGGMPSAAKWAAAAAVVALLAGGGYVLTRRPVEPVKPPDPDTTITQKTEVAPPPPAKDEPRSLTAEEGLQLNSMISGERFQDAENFLSKLKPVLKEDSFTMSMATVKGARTTACEDHMQRVTALIAERKFDAAEEDLDRAADVCSESDRLLFNKLLVARKKGNCPEVIALANAIAERYPDSTRLKQANDYKRACMLAPAVTAAELKRALAAVQGDINRCLEAPRPPDQTSNSVDLAWTVNPAGTVGQVSCTTPSMLKSALCTCLNEQVRRLRFVANPELKARRGQYTFTASTSG